MTPPAPLRIPAYRRLWLAATLSNVGSFLQTVAASWLMLQLTGSPLWVGLMVGAPTLPLLLLALPAGAMADLFDRRRVLLGGQALMALAAAATAALWFLGTLTPGLLLALGLLLGVGMALNMPSWQALVPDLVPAGQVPSAVALNSASFNVARAIGPALGGLIVATLGPGAAFAMNAVSYLAVIGAVAALDRRQLPQAGEAITSAIAGGLRFARFTPALRKILGLTSLFALTSAVLQAMLPNFTADVLGGGASGYGVLLGAMGVGALAGAFARPWGAARLGPSMVPVSMTAFGVAGVLVGLSRTLVLACAFMAVAGLLWVWILATINATTQLLSPGWIRGRMMSLYTLSLLGFIPLGSILAGAVGDVIGAAGSIILLSSGTVLLGLVAFRLPLPILDQIVTPEPVADYRPPVPHPTAVTGDPVMILTTYTIDEADLAAFLDVMDELRAIRLRTGAYRWRLYRNVGDAHRITEMFLLSSWEQHLRQHRRIDAQALATISRARAFDCDGAPVTHHLAAIDIADPAHRPDWEELVAVHDAMHADGPTPPATAPPAPTGAEVAGR